MRAHRWWVLALLVVVAVACGGDDSDRTAASTATEGPVEIRVGALPIGTHLAVFQADEAGYFEEEGLAVTIEPIQGGTDVFAPLVAEELEFGTTNSVSFIQSLAEDLPVGLVTYLGAVRPEMAAVIVPERSDITEAEDLVGATVAINTLNNVGDLSLYATLDGLGIDGRSVELVEIPFEQMGAALESGSVDAAELVDPFLSSTLAQIEATVLLDPFGGPPMEGLPTTIIVAKDEYAAENPEVIEAFRRAVDRATADLNDDLDAARTLLAELVDAPPEAIADIVLPTFESEFPTEDLQEIADLMVTYEFIDERLDVSPAVES